jgi:HTH-type transcriptional regulator, transcriptional repressor of NAD biosynthesis genes
MKRGLVIGKFLPIHNGHIALINFAASQCDEVIVSMSYTDQDPISADLRFSWINEIFKDRPTIKPAMIRDDFDNEQLPLPERTKKWSEVIGGAYPPIDVLISSETYGEPFALNHGIKHISFDAERKNHPVSATKIRQNPFNYWEYIPEVVRPFFVKKLCLYGPESTGKSTLAIKLANRYQTEYVPEVAREFINSNDFTLDDIIKIARAHIDRIEQKTKTAHKILICDTDCITTQIYCRHYLKVVPDILYELEKKVDYSKYFLLDIDVPWVGDGLRDLGHHREFMMKTFKDELIQRGIDFVPVQGTYEEREEIISREIDRIMSIT